MKLKELRLKCSDYVWITEGKANVLAFNVEFSVTQQIAKEMVSGMQDREKEAIQKALTECQAVEKNPAKNAILSEEANLI